MAISLIPIRFSQAARRYAPDAYSSHAKKIRLTAHPGISTGCRLGVALEIVLIKMQAGI
jgi:hypothetical protein